MALLGPWIDADDIIGDEAICPSCVQVQSITVEAATAACLLASSVLYELSGRKWAGVGSQTVRPAARPRLDPLPPETRVTMDRVYLESPPGWHESWGWYEFDDSRDIAGRRQITLGFYPIVTITEVRVDGVVLDPSAYRVDESRMLVRQDGDLWPCRQDWWRPEGDDRTWAVDFDYGTEAPAEAQLIAAVYACEIAKSLCGVDCQLPARTQSITRQGVSQVLFDPLDLVADGMIGLPMVDTWIKAVNPDRRRRRAMVSSPDIGRRVRYG